MTKFRVPVTLIQPSVAAGAAPTEHRVMARRVDDGGGSGPAIIDGALAAPAGATWDLERAPVGLGTRWKAVVEDVAHQIDSVVEPHEHRNVVRVSLSSTAFTGALARPAEPPPSGSPSGSPPAAPPPADHGGPGTGS